jgi:predicted NAD/FAD-binding protein
MRIAIVGTGIAGNTAAYCLNAADHVNAIVVYEQDLRIGGHSATVDINYRGRAISVDTGFIVYNELNYPNLTDLFRHLGTETDVSDMSFSVSLDRGRFEWAGRSGAAASVVNGVFAQRRNLASPRFWRMLSDVLRFQKQSVADRRANLLEGMSLGEYLSFRGFCETFRNDYILPMGGAIWSTPIREMLEFPACSFVSFFENHRLLERERPIWRTVRGGSRSYVETMTRSYRDRIRLGARVTEIARDARGVTVSDSLGGIERFDHVVVAAHAPDALAMLVDPSDAERDTLSAITYRPNDVYLHCDDRLMPKRRAAWSAWNFLREGQDDSADLAVTYWMNKLQNIDVNYPLFVSLNPPFAPRSDTIFGRFSYDHPQYDLGTLAAQRRLGDIQGKNRTWFCGAWTGYGFHEDGMKAGLRVAEALGAEAPWHKQALVRLEAAE